MNSKHDFHDPIQLTLKKLYLYIYIDLYNITSYKKEQHKVKKKLLNNIEEIQNFTTNEIYI